MQRSVVSFNSSNRGFLTITTYRYPMYQNLYGRTHTTLYMCTPIFDHYKIIHSIDRMFGDSKSKALEQVRSWLSNVDLVPAQHRP